MIDADVRLSPGWWMYRLSRKQADPVRLARLDWLDRYYRGDLDLPTGAQNAREAFQHFLRKTRSNFGELIVGAVKHRQALTGFQTLLENGEVGDKVANDLWRAASGDVFAADVHLFTGKFGEAWALVGAIDEETGVPTLTAEDPRQMVGECDPTNPLRTVASFKTFYDDVYEVSKAYLYLPGHLYVAKSPGGRRGRSAARFNPKTWVIDEEASGQIPDGLMPAVRYEVNDGFGEFENHKDVLDRITDGVLQRMTIALMQAFKQRAVKGLPDKYTSGPRIGQTIDYSDVFTADPASIWQLPAAAEMWESGAVDLTGVLAAGKADVGHLSAVTSTPMYMLMPEGANQSAEGAKTSRESLVTKVEDRILRLTPSHARTMSNMLKRAGEKDRAKLSGIRPLWRSPERLSLTERADAASKANDIPWRSKMIHIWGFDPDTVDRMESERADDALLERLFAGAAAAADPTTPPVKQPPASGTDPAAAPDVIADGG